MMGTKFFVFRFGDFEVREREFSLVKAGEVLPVEPKAFRALLFLLHNPQKLIPKEELIQAVWGDTAVADGSLTRCIWLLRRLLGDDFNEPRYIETVATVGYRFVCKVDVSEDASGILESTGQPPVNGKAAEAAANESEQANEVAVGETKSERLNGGGRRRFRKWLIPGAGLSTVALAAAVWYLHHPLPPPRITNIRQITNDGMNKRSFVTDGSRIYYSALVGKEDKFFQVSTQGGEPVPMPQLDGMYPVDISGDHSELLLWKVKDYTHWVASVLGSAPRPLGDLDGGDARWSPKGDQIVSAKLHEIRIARSDGSALQTLVKMESPAFGPRWSHDSRTIRFSLWTADGTFIWEVGTDGAGLHRLFPQWTDYDQWLGTWSPDGKYFVFIAAQDNTAASDDLWAVRESGGRPHSGSRTPVRLTSGPLTIDSPEFGPDGKRIFLLGMLDRGELVRYDFATKQWLPVLQGLSAVWVDFSRDGKWITYARYPDLSIWRSAVDGSQKLQLIGVPLEGSNPRWSPDGTQVSFVASRPPEGGRVYVQMADGSGLRKLTNGECGRDGESDPVWSPDSASVVFGCIPGPNSGLSRETAVLRIVDLKSGHISILPGSQGLWSPRWSPDGRYIAAIAFPRPYKLMLYDPQSRQQRELYPKGMGWPSWSRDNQYVYFGIFPGDAEYRVRVSDLKVERVADVTASSLSPRGTYGWVGLTPDGSLLGTREASNFEIYALDWDAP
jgi:Tol biopolymer transport system component/DNA-binding winged helix-turn-helix (wHTH) protein